MNLHTTLRAVNSQELQLAVTHNLITRLKDVGKIRLQKMMYFLQETTDVPTKLSFRMHHYGPFSEDLETDTTWLKLAGYVKIERDSQGYGFHIIPADEPREEWSDMIERYGESIDQVVAIFAPRTTPELELLATIHYVKCLQPDLPSYEILKIVRALKPKFNESYVAQTHAELEQLGILG